MKTEDYKGKNLREYQGGISIEKSNTRAAAFASLYGVHNTQEYNNLGSREARQGFLDSVVSDTQASTRNWAEFYSLIDLLCAEDWYWKDAGFDSFPAFWHDRTGEAFARLEELESLYNFAKMANPKLFNMPLDKALKQFSKKDRQIASLVPVRTAQHAGGNRGNRYAAKAADSMNRIHEANAYKEPGGNSIERRFRNLKRDAPEIAAKVLAGEYVKEFQGEKVLDMNQAEKDAYGMSNTERNKKMRDKKQKSRDEDLLNNLLKTKSMLRRKTLVATLKKCDWLMEEIQNDTC